MALPLAPPIQPQLARAARELPEGEGWRYEPKWDGFRTIVFRDGPQVQLQSRNGRPMNRYFPEVVELLLELPE
jgi:ATP-dependent DNA ligase